MPPHAPAILPPDFVAMMQRGVSVIVASCGREGLPSIMRAVGSAVDDGGQRVTVFLSSRQSRQLLLDVQATGRIAAVFSEPPTHRTVQLKARAPSIRPAGESDVPALARYLQSMEHELSQVGLRPEFTRAMLARRLEDLVAVSFTPDEAFNQTPGPRAGCALAGTAQERAP